MSSGYMPAVLPRVLFPLLLAALFLGGCSGKQAVQFKINSEPEGAHVVYRVTGSESPGHGDWIYLGNTPIRSVRQLDEDTVSEADKITLKVMRAGYFDQIREWDGAAFWEEVSGKGVIFWTPRLVPQPAEK